METSQSPSVAHYGHVNSSNRSRMAIDALLNPPIDSSVDGYLVSRPSDGQHHHHHHHHHHQQAQAHLKRPHSPGSSTSSSNYYYSQYRDSSASYTDTSGSTQDAMFMAYQPRSTNSSPDPYSRDRYDSVSSSSSNAAERRRPPRPKYEEEEMYFIWYHRVDLCQEWKEVRESFNRQFPSRQRRGFQGIQCKFYRFIKEKRCPTLREQRRLRDGEFLREGSHGSDSGAPRYGVIEWMEDYYEGIEDYYYYYYYYSEPVMAVGHANTERPEPTDSSSSIVSIPVFQYFSTEYNKVPYLTGMSQLDRKPSSKVNTEY
ncbi:hypothetical protein ASPZODRAFT_146286 [Penicilliopsis zonata CBS 506.65]|uniref:Uncharacterized protein n=1 Tax=Penicilliopsis zonata CBS 506.65 TaxID=1073090 RepID=A0A1L9S7X8_9EURO|nr:hypothetical protein ASPZODRAFT_146286 [Penicilliopsis zonata CBS 506.65]OJJ43268.1 hypothetical protein ASPZODRAFT_146286 [Penicilliopsis zonata CBS 506.65]